MTNTDKNHPIQLATIQLEGIEVDIEVGIDPHENDRIQRLVIDVEVGFDDRLTRIPDSPEGLKEGFNYATIYEIICTATKTKTYLLETIANHIADSVMANRAALTCMVRISKTRCWPNAARTGIKIFRQSNRI